MNTPIKVSRPNPSPMRREKKPSKSIQDTLSFIVKTRSNSNVSKIDNNDESNHWDET